MSYLIVGLGNPGEEYTKSRHNAGRIVLEQFLKKNDFGDFETDKTINALKAKGVVAEEKVSVVLPETFMNNSGKSLVKLITSKKQAEKLVVVYDDMDLPVGKIKISFNRSSGGHNGVESIIKSIKTEEFVRVRIGVTPQLASGKLKKPKGEEAVHKFILGKFSPNETEVLKKVSKVVNEAIISIITEGREQAMGKFN